VGMAVVIMACGHRYSRAIEKLRRVMFVVFPLMSDCVTDTPQTGQGPDGDEQQRTPPDKPKPAGRHRWAALFSPCHCHPPSLTSNMPSRRRPTHRRHQAALESPSDPGRLRAHEYGPRAPAPSVRLELRASQQLSEAQPNSPRRWRALFQPLRPAREFGARD
jgi:hypothetical protein